MELSCRSYIHGVEGRAPSTYLCGSICEEGSTLWAGAIENEAQKLLLPGLTVCSGDMCNERLCSKTYTVEIVASVISAICLIAILVAMMAKFKAAKAFLSSMFNRVARLWQMKKSEEVDLDQELGNSNEATANPNQYCGIM